MTIPYRELFAAAGAKYGVDPALLAAVAKQESGFSPRAESPAGARGMMQLMPEVAASLAVDPWDPAQAVDGAARLLRQNLARFGSAELAAAAYNAGPGAVAQYHGVPPYPETQTYVRNVLAYRDAFEGDFQASASSAGGWVRRHPVITVGLIAAGVAAGVAAVVGYVRPDLVRRLTA